MRAKKLLAGTGVALLVVVAGVGGLIGLMGAGVVRLGVENVRPAFVVSEIHAEYYDGVSDDLLTGGLGLEGIQGPKPPPYRDNFNPQVDELRKNAVYNNYRALFDTTAAGGFGSILGPNIAADGSPGYEDTISGWEYMAYDDGAGGQQVTMMVQIPDSFDPKNACIISGPSSGSRGVYGAIGITGDWGLKHGCAVAYTDKGNGTGVHDLWDDTVTLMRGERVPRAVAGKDSNFTAEMTDEQLAAYNAKYPYRMAFKHAHSQRNAEAHWGLNVLNSIEFAFYVLNERYGIKIPGTDVTLVTIKPENTIVIAGGVSNGASASLLAAEQDTKGLIDGVAVSEPNSQVSEPSPFEIVQGDTVMKTHGKSLYDYYTLQSLYQPCASIAAANARAPFNLLPRMLGQNRCAALVKHGLLKSTTVEEQADEAQKIINDYGLTVEQNVLGPSHMAFDVYPNIAVNYGYAYGRFSVLDNLCGYSFASVDSGNTPGPIKKETMETMFGYGTGIPPIGPIQIIYNDAANGPIKHVAAISKSTGIADMGLDGQLCLRALATGVDPITNQPLTGEMLAMHERVKKGIAERQNSGRLNGKPTLIVHGRADAVIAINHASRSYLATNILLESEKAPTRYYEVANAQHLDALIQFPGFTDKYVPLHYYLVQVMDLMYDHLKNGRELPPSQVIHPTPRKPGETLTRENLPGISENPGPMAITWTGSQLRIPE